MSNKRKLAIIGTVGVPANYGGFETLTEHLITGLRDNYDITVYCSGKKYKKSERQKMYNGASLKYIPLDANGIQSIPYDSLSILHALFFSDVLLILGVAGAWLLPFVRFFTNKKIIISIDGIEWKREKWNLLAKLYLFWAESLAVKYSHIDISDNEAIQDYTAARYGSLSRIIEYGADHVIRSTKLNELAPSYLFKNELYAIKVCRIEPENNVHKVLEAFKSIHGLSLVIIGNWDKSEYGMKLRKQYAAYKHIYLLDPIYDQKKLDVLRNNAFLYIHGHSAGGTNPSLIEAMYLGLPLLAYNVSYNRATTENKAIYFKSPEELIYQISNLTNERRLELSSSMREIAERRYVWSKISFKYYLLVEEAFKTNNKTSVYPITTSINYDYLLKSGYAHLKTTYQF